MPAARRFAVFFLLAGLLTGCALPQLPSPAARPAVYDLGPLPAVAAAGTGAPPLVLEDIAAPNALDGTAMLYRLLYANAQELRPYALARWSMTPAQLLQQRLRARLGEHHGLRTLNDCRAHGQACWLLRLELQEFSQHFDRADRSTARIGLRATLLRSSAAGPVWVAQRPFWLEQAATGADAAAGAQALAQCADATAAALRAWLAEQASSSGKSGN